MQTGVNQEEYNADSRELLIFYISADNTHKGAWGIVSISERGNIARCMNSIE